MQKKFNTIEDVIADEHFLAWYFRDGSIKAKEWEQWLDQNQPALPLVEQSIDWLNTHRLAETEISTQQIKAAHDKLMNTLGGAPVITMKSRQNLRWIPAAAAILILVAAGFLFWTKTGNKTTLDSAYGTINQYNLPDGSQVTLNANSRITIGKQWKEGADREVWLQGEAFFKVQKTAMKNRFVVHANNMDIIVTGTQFNVIAREDESSVLLTEGSVIIKTPDGNEIKMTPGDYVRIENKIPARQTVDQQRVLAWTESKLDFDKTPIYDVAKIIARHYGVKVSVPDRTIGEFTISGIMPNDNLDVLIEALEATGDFKITKVNSEIIISGP